MYASNIVYTMNISVQLIAIKASLFKNLTLILYLLIINISVLVYIYKHQQFCFAWFEILKSESGYSKYILAMINEIFHQWSEIQSLVSLTVFCGLVLWLIPKMAPRVTYRS